MCIERLFDSLPSQLERLRPLRRKALGRMYMARGFEAQSLGRVDAAVQAFKQGMRLDPTWLRNRGVLSAIIRTRR